MRLRGAERSPSWRRARGLAAGAVLSVALLAGSGAPAGASTPIERHYEELGGGFGVLGPPVGAEHPGPEGGRYQDYSAGAIYWSPRTGAHAVRGEILRVWRAMSPFRPFGDGRPALGYPTADEMSTNAYGDAAAYSDFQGGSIAYRPGMAIRSLVTSRCVPVYATCTPKVCMNRGLLRLVGLLFPPFAHFPCVRFRPVDRCDPHRVADAFNDHPEDALSPVTDQALGEVTTPIKKATGYQGWISTHCVVHGAWGIPVRRAQRSTDGFWTIDLRIAAMSVEGVKVTGKRFIRLEVRPDHPYAHRLVSAHPPGPRDIVAFGGLIQRDHTTKLTANPFHIAKERYGFLEVHPDGEFAINPPSPRPPAPSPTRLAMTCPVSALVNGPLDVSGTLTPGQANRTVTVAYRRPDGSVVTDTVHTDRSGAYADRQVLDQQGTWMVAGAFAGDATGTPSTSAPCQVEVAAPAADRIGTTIGLVCPSVAYYQDGLHVHGAINPPVVGVGVDVYYQPPDRTEPVHHVITGANGDYSDDITPSAGQVGSWSMWAEWAGDATHQGAKSAVCTTDVRSVPIY